MKTRKERDFLNQMWTSTERKKEGSKKRKRVSIIFNEKMLKAFIFNQGEYRNSQLVLLKNALGEASPAETKKVGR